VTATVRRTKYKHMSVVLGQADGDVATTIETLQRTLGLSDSEFLRSIVHTFLVDRGYAKPIEPSSGSVVLGDIKVDKARVRKLKNKLDALTTEL